MRIAVIGLGYVGLVTAACTAAAGHDVVGVDIDEERLARLRLGRVPFHEPGLSELVAEHHATGRLRFVADAAEAVADADLVFVAVNTHDGNGGWHTGTIVRCLVGLVPALPDDTVLVVRSTLPPDFVARLGPLVRGIRLGAGRTVTPVAINPEFTRESTAIRDFLSPDRVVIGVVDDPKGVAESRLTELYRPFGAPIITMPGADAVMTKLGANLFLATKISFANELARLCERFGADVSTVVEGIGGDPRIGHAFLRAGLGFGGSCLPNQVSMTVRTAAEHGVQTPLLAAVHAINGDQRARFVDRLRLLAGGELEGRRVALLGLTFKPETDDLRDAPSLDIAERLLALGARVVAHDPMERARERAAALVPGLEVTDSAFQALRGADVAGLVTEWAEYRDLDWSQAHTLMAAPLIVDGRNALDAEELGALGFLYVDFGRRGLRDLDAARGAPPGTARPGVDAEHVA